MTESIPQILYCANHPDRETTLRCNRCEKLICPKCAVLTPTGYRCKECVRGQQKIFDTATTVDYPLAFITAGILSYIGSLIAQFLGFFIIIIAPIIGLVIAEAVRFVIRKRRSKGLFLTAAGATVLGSLPNILLPLTFLLFSVRSGAGLEMGFTGISIIWHVVYTVLVTSSMFYQLSGSHLRL